MSAPAGEWKSSVEVREEPELARRLVTQLPAADAPRAVSVTDLIGLRRAYWRAIRPVPFAEDRQHRVEQGRALHRRLGLALSTEGQLEVRVRRFGVSGRIDLLSDVPVEVKTSSSAVAAESLKSSRPDQLEQLAMYCALTARPVGRLVTLATEEGQVGSVRAAEIRLTDIDGVRAEMRARADRLVQAWARQSSDGLPACRWYGRGCEFQEAGACDCSGTDPTPSAAVLDPISEVTDRPEVGERIAARWKEVEPLAHERGIERFRTLLYPRRAYFDRRSPKSESVRPLGDPLAPLDLYWRAMAALESGPVGEVAQLSVPTGDPEEDVLGFLGEPVLVKTSRGRDPATAPTLLDRQPQYGLEMGFRAAATGHDVGYLVLARERAARPDQQLQVFRFRFAPVDTFSRIWADRSHALTAAELGAAPGGLDACPDWMYPDCPYRSECHCGGAPDRSQR